MSKSTLVSIVPFPIAEMKPGIYPGFFELPASRNNNPECLVIGDSKFFVEIDENRTITVWVPSDKLAQSVVNDYITSNLAYSQEKNAAPGFFWVEGELTSEDIVKKFSTTLLEQAKRRQSNWFEELVKMADDDWEKTRQHKFISDMQRHAAKSMKLERPWLITPNIDSGLVACIACQSLISPNAIICPSCKMIINMEKYKQLQFAEK